MSGESLVRSTGDIYNQFHSNNFFLTYKYREISIVPLIMFALITLNTPQRNNAVHTEISQLTCAFFLNM